MSSPGLMQGAQGTMTIQLRFSMLAGALFLWSMVGFPLVASTLNAVGLPSTEIVIVARMIVLAVCLVMIAAGLASRRSPHNAAFVLFLVFFAAYMVRMAYDTAYVPHLLGRPGYIYWAFGVGTCFAPALAIALFARDLDIIRLYRPLMLLSAVILLLAITVGDTMVESVASGDTYDTGRLALEALNPISLGHVGASVVILIYWRVRMLGDGIGSVLLSLPLGLLGSYVLFATGSRGPLVALVLAIVFFEAVKGGRAAIFLALVAAPFLATLTIDVDQVEAALGTNLFSRLDTAYAGSDASSIGRLAQLSSAWDMFLDAPLFGAALEDPAFGIYPHNIFVEAFMATGVFGGTMLIVLLGMSGWLAFRISRSNTTLSIYGALFVQYLIAAQFSGAIWSSSTLWVLVGCVAGLAVRRNSSAGRTDRTAAPHGPITSERAATVLAQNTYST